jgi:hypothetical protein
MGVHMVIWAWTIALNSTMVKWV